MQASATASISARVDGRPAMASARTGAAAATHSGVVGTGGGTVSCPTVGRSAPPHPANNSASTTAIFRTTRNRTPYNRRPQCGHSDRASREYAVTNNDHAPTASRTSTGPTHTTISTTKITAAATAPTPADGTPLRSTRP